MHATPRRRRQWHRTYVVLALFNVLVVASGLVLNHKLNDIFKASVAENHVWELRLDKYLDLNRLAGKVDAPGNNVFATRDPARQSQKMTLALGEFENAFRPLFASLDSLPSDQSVTIGHDLSLVDAAMAEMVTEASHIFRSFTDGNEAAAVLSRATMDRRYFELSATLAKVNDDVTAIQQQLFLRQNDRADSLQRYEALIALLVVIVIVLAILYGVRMRRDQEDADRERSSYILELEVTERELRAAREKLEERVHLRTAELAEVNISLRKEAEQRARALEAIERANHRLELQARRLAESNRDLQDFAYVASHDLQEPLRKILAFGDRLETKFANGLDDTGRDYLARIRNASTRMQVLINDLLVFSRVQTKGDVHQDASLTDIANDVISDLEVAIEGSGATIEVGALPLVEGDPLQMRQLLQNLIGNALKFRRPEVAPVVSISAEVVLQGQPGPHGPAEEKMCVLRVTDNGIGFEPEYAEKIFTVFQRLHGRDSYEGSGVGLAICRRIAERHGGSITASSEPGVGTTFEVTLPLTQPATDEGGVDAPGQPYAAAR